jgi:diguanylate cyclase (GGDEF)-like protein
VEWPNVTNDGAASPDQAPRADPVPLSVLAAVALDAIAITAAVALVAAAGHWAVDRGLAFGILIGIGAAVLIGTIRGSPTARAAAGARLVVPEIVIIAVALATLPLALAMSVDEPPRRAAVGLAAVVALALGLRTTLFSRRADQYRRVQAGRVAELTRLALHDPLTRLPNRTLFEDRLTMALAAQRRTGALLAVLFCDLDDFKHVNDTLGHDTGDAVLLVMAGRLRAAVRATDTVSRQGGDEFVVLCPDLSGETELTDVVERLLSVLAEPVRVDHREMVLSASVGVAVARPESAPTSMAELLREADAAMYRAKAEGRNRWARVMSGRPVDGGKRRYTGVRDSAPDPSWALPAPTASAD